MSQCEIKFKSNIIGSLCLFANRGSHFLKFLTKTEFQFSKLYVYECAHQSKEQESAWVFTHPRVCMCVGVILQQKSNSQKKINKHFTIEFQLSPPLLPILST